MGFTKKQRREQKKYHAEHKVYTRKVPGNNVVTDQAARSVPVSTARTSPNGEQYSDKNLNPVPQSTDPDSPQS